VKRLAEVARSSHGTEEKNKNKKNKQKIPEKPRSIAWKFNNTLFAVPGLNQIKPTLESLGWSQVAFNRL